MIIDTSHITVIENQIEFDISCLEPGHCAAIMTFKLDDYPLHRHCCYMRIKNEDLDKEYRRFHDLIFSMHPPGKVVGPWPGWRNIPDMPLIELCINDQCVEATYNFWGDEFEIHKIRTIAYLEISTRANQALLRWGDSRLKPLQIQFIPSTRKSVHPSPFVPNFKSEHPKLLFNKETVVNWQHTNKNENIRSKIETLLNNRHLEFEASAQSKILAGEERLGLQDRAVLSAFDALLCEEKKSIERAKDAMSHFMNRALSRDFEPMNIDTQAGDCLFLLCLCYDWLYSFFTQTQRERYREKCFLVAKRVWQHLGYERTDYAQAHFLGCSHGLLAFGILFYNHYDIAFEWLAYLRAVFNRVMDMVPDDGFYPHGINLWIYEHQFLLRYAELLHLHSEDHYWSQPYWQNASLFRHAATSADAKYGVTFGDPQYRTGGDAWMHYLIAARTGNPHAQALADKLSDQPVTGIDLRNAPPRRRVWEYIYCCDHINASALPDRSYYFADGQQLFWKSKDLVATVRAGAPLGTSRYRNGEWSGYGHSDPAQGSFLIAIGDKLVINGAGPVYRRETLLHNTITIGGRGQIGDSLPWAPEYIPNNRFAEVTEHHQTKYYDKISMNLKPAYLGFLGVKRLERSLYYIRQRQIVIHDSIELKRRDEIQWNLHTFGKIETDNPSHLKIRDGNIILHLYCLLPQNPSFKSGRSDFVPAYPHNGERDTCIQFSHVGHRCEFLFVLDLPLVDGEQRPHLDYKTDHYTPG